MGVDVGPAGAVILIRVLALEPLSGTAATAGSPEQAFEGWMELIGAVASLVGLLHCPPHVDQGAAYSVGEPIADK